MKFDTSQKSSDVEDAKKSACQYLQENQIAGPVEN